MALTQQLTTVNELVERVSLLVWNGQSSAKGLARFLKEFRDSPRRSAQVGPFVENFCTRIFQWFVVAAAEDLGEDWKDGLVAISGGYRFMEVASYVGHLVERGLLNPELVRLHLIKPLTTHHYPSPNGPAETVRANAIYRLFYIAGDTLLRGLLEPEDVRVSGPRRLAPEGIIVSALTAFISGTKGVRQPCHECEVQCSLLPVWNAL